MRKFIWISILVVVLAAAGAAYWAFSNLDRLAKQVIEEAGSQALGVAVRVKSVDIQLAKRQATLKGLTVANPPGFSKQAAMSFGSITVQMSGIKGDIKRVVAVDPVLRVELKGAANNLSQLRAKAKRAEGKPAPAASASPEQNKIIKVELLKVDGAKAILTGPDLKQPVDIGVSHLEMHNLRGTPQQIAGQIFGRLLDITMAKAASVAVQRGLGKIMNKQESYGQGVTDFLERLGGVKK